MVHFRFINCEKGMKNQLIIWDALVKNYIEEIKKIPNMIVKNKIVKEFIIQNLKFKKT